MSLIAYIPWIVFYLVSKGSGVPPDACFAKFRSDDCGEPPKPVMYYWKPGSRCEVGIWRGCLPNVNMFEDEYECVSTCMFSARAAAVDYHSNNEIDDKFEDIDILIKEENSATTPDGSDNNTPAVTTSESTASEEDTATTIPTTPSNENGNETISNTTTITTTTESDDEAILTDTTTTATAEGENDATSDTTTTIAPPPP